jgi:hypothetical protein
MELGRSQQGVSSNRLVGPKADIGLLVTPWQGGALFVPNLTFA